MSDELERIPGGPYAIEFLISDTVNIIAREVGYRQCCILPRELFHLPQHEYALCD